MRRTVHDRKVAQALLGTMLVENFTDKAPIELHGDRDSTLIFALVVIALAGVLSVVIW